MPGATQEQAASFNELQRRTTSPECAARYFDIMGDIDITDLLAKVTAKTLVMHVRGDLVCPVEAGRALAVGIPGARFVGKRAGFAAVLRGNQVILKQLISGQCSPVGCLRRRNPSAMATIGP
jgi:pimeloyl-ACP methyl ester carboxylesterase